MAVTALTNSQQSRLATCSVLAWHKTEPGRHVAAVPECSGITDGGHKSGRDQRTDAMDLGEATTRLTRPEDLADSAIDHSDLTLQLDELVVEFAEQRSSPRR